MRYIDVFNGDADGICALTQIRNAHRVESTLVTGVKRDIELLETVEASEGDEITVLDISMDKNKAALLRVLEAGARVLYVDHHFAGDIPEHQGLTAVINEAADVCTSVLVNTRLGGAFVEWAIVGAFGDNLSRVANALARPLGFPEDALRKLENLGTYINYNGYGPTEEDLYFRPRELFGIVSKFASPFQLIAARPDVYERLETGYRDDMRRATTLPPSHATDKVAVFILPDEPWARRVSGVYGNDLANGTPDRAHAVLSPHPDGGFVVSVRAPLTNKKGADVLCRSFPTGGGRAAAAGINNLPVDAVDRFIEAFSAQYA
jgi:hypothetical protein